MKTIYDLEIHESIEQQTNGSTKFTITRVASGWIYENYRLDAGQMTSVFVPYDNTLDWKPESESKLEKEYLVCSTEEDCSIKVGYKIETFDGKVTWYECLTHEKIHVTHFQEMPKRIK